MQLQDNEVISSLIEADTPWQNGKGTHAPLLHSAGLFAWYAQSLLLDLTCNIQHAH